MVMLISSRLARARCFGGCDEGTGPGIRDCWGYDGGEGDGDGTGEFGIGKDARDEGRGEGGGVNMKEQ